ncbi:MAG: glycosyltransferase [Deltaproteobacteria bacterium]|nr:glycosyltransferase [Deltaproteobacteria bacterium]
MRIGYVLTNFPALSETFIRREILGLCKAGHRLFVYTNYRHHHPFVPEPQEPNLAIRQVSFLNNPPLLVSAGKSDGIEHIHSSLMIAAQRAAKDVADKLQIPFTLTVYSGHDIFTATDPNLYRTISSDPFCEAIIVEDPYMRRWVVNKLGVDPHKIEIISNSFDLELYRLKEQRHLHESIVILAIARFVEKKGLIYLINAFNKLCQKRHNAELWLVGEGPEEPKLQSVARGNTHIRFLGSTSESHTRQLYQDADIFCLPCIRTDRGDADGVPTTILEAMAFELPVVTSDLLSTPYYVRHLQEGLLVSPGDVQAITNALDTLCADAHLRKKLGRTGRKRVTKLCNFKENIKKLEAIVVNSRWRRWNESLDRLLKRRKHYTAAIKERYRNDRERSVKYFQPTGRLLDIGCGQGELRFHLHSEVIYFGCDPIISTLDQGTFPFVVALGEALPFRNETFDAAMLYCVIVNVFDVDSVLSEARRILNPGGLLYLRVCINDPNPIHLNHFCQDYLLKCLSEELSIMDSTLDGENVLLIKAKKPEIQKIKAISTRPLVSIAITAFNREKYIKKSIQSALQQTYQPVEVVVVDDGSMDRTRYIIKRFGSKIRSAFNQSNKGIAYSKNRALHMTSEEARYVAILDSDDYFHPHFVEQCVTYLESSNQIGFVYTDDILIDSHGQEIQRRRAVHPWNIDKWLRTCNLRGDTWMARRELIMQTQLHDEALTHDLDYDLFYQLLEITNFAHLQKYLVYYRQHNGQSAYNYLQLAKCHAANLVKYGYSPEYAYHRARKHPEWVPAIEEGIALGRRLREQRLKKASDKI